MSVAIAVGFGLLCLSMLSQERRTSRRLAVQLADARKYGDYWWSAYREMRTLALAQAEATTRRANLELASRDAPKEPNAE